MKGVKVPEYIGVMVLPECVLFPHGALPLNIFEPRYRKMLNDALEGDCVFGIVNKLRDGDESDFSRIAAPIGTVGLIRASQEAENGTSQLVLHGFLRMKIEEWSYDKPYPCARISPLTFDLDENHNLAPQIKRLKDIVRQSVSSLEDEIQTYIMETLERATHPHILADIVSQQFVHESQLRQELLEINDAEMRLNFLITHLSR